MMNSKTQILSQSQFDSLLVLARQAVHCTEGLVVL